MPGGNHGQAAIPPPPTLPAGLNIPPPPPHPNQLPTQGGQHGGPQHAPQQPRPMAPPMAPPMGQHMGQQMGQQMGHQQQMNGGFNGGHQPGQMGPPMGMAGGQNQFPNPQFAMNSQQFAQTTSTKYRAYEFSKPELRDVDSGERPSWSMVSTADKIDIAPSDIQRRIKTREIEGKKSVLDQYNDLPDSRMRYLIKKLIDDLNYQEGNPWREWKMALIETDKKEYIQNRARVKHIATMRVFLKQVTREEVRDIARSQLSRTRSLGGSVDLSGPRLPVGMQQLPAMGMQPQNMGMHGANMPLQGGINGPQNMMPSMQQPFGNMGMQGGMMHGQPGAAVNLPGQQPFAQGGAFGAAGKAGKPGQQGMGNNGGGAPGNVIKINANNKPAKKSGSKERKSSKSKHRRGRSGHSSDSSDSDSDSNSSSSDSELEDRVGDVEKKMRRLSDNVKKMSIGRRSSTSSRLPHPPMGPDRRASSRPSMARRSSFDHRRSNPMAIPRRQTPKMIERERFYMTSDHGRGRDRDYSDGYASSGSRNSRGSWVGGESAFSRPSSDYTPPSSFDGRGMFNDNPFREHRKPSARGYGTPPLSPGQSDYDYDYDHGRHSSRRSTKYLPEGRTGYNEYFDVPRRRSSSRRDDYRRQSEDARDHIRARKQWEDRDRYMRDERNMRASRAGVY